VGLCNYKSVELWWDLKTSCMSLDNMVVSFPAYLSILTKKGLTYRVAALKHHCSTSRNINYHNTKVIFLCRWSLIKVEICAWTYSLCKTKNLHGLVKIGSVHAHIAKPGTKSTAYHNIFILFYLMSPLWSHHKKNYHMHLHHESHKIFM